MAFFSSLASQKKVENKPQAIPPEILSSVRVMGEEKKASHPENLPIQTETPQKVTPAPMPSAVPSPFLTSLPPKPPQSAQTPPPAPPSPSPDKKAPVVSEASMGEAKGFPKVAPVSFLPSTQKPVEKAASGKKGIVFAVVGACILLSVAGGGYYYWQNSSAQDEGINPGEAPLPSLPDGTLPPSQTGMPDALSPIRTLPYALDKPNYLSIDTETAEVAGVRKNIDDVASRLIEGNFTEPIEFIITDTNNNPLAFSRFVYLLNLSLPQELLAEIEEPFSLYLSSENGRAVVGLELALKDPARGNTLVELEYESGLPQQLAPLLYSGTNITVPASVSFTPSPSRADAQVVRYHNFSLNPNISFDYTISGKQWFIGTSKDMFRLMLEKSE